MNRNTYSSFQEAMKFRYNATNEDIQILLSTVPELEQNWNNYGKSHLLNIDLALFYGIKF